MRIKLLLPFLTSFAVLLACIYSLSYWGSLNINALQFMSLKQLALASVKAFIWMPIAMILGALIGTEMARETGELREKGEHTRAKIQDWFMNALMIVAAIVGLVLMILDRPMWPFFVSPAVGVLVGTWIASENWIPESIASPPMVFLITFFAVVLLLSAHGIGRIEAEKIISGDAYLAIDDDACADRFAGKVGDVLVFYQPSSESTRISHLHNSSELSLFSKRGETCDAL